MYIYIYRESAVGCGALQNTFVLLTFSNTQGFHPSSRFGHLPCGTRVSICLCVCSVSLLFLLSCSLSLSFSLALPLFFCVHMPCSMPSPFSLFRSILFVSRALTPDTHGDARDNNRLHFAELFAPNLHSGTPLQRRSPQHHKPKCLIEFKPLLSVFRAQNHDHKQWPVLGLVARQF